MARAGTPIETLKREASARVGVSVDDPLLALLPRARRRWARTDPVLHALSRAAPPPARALVRRERAFESLLESIVHQQVSLHAGRAIHARVVAEAGDVTPSRILAMEPERLRAAGLSGRKVLYALDLAAHFESGALQDAALAQMPDSDVIEAVTRVKGLGIWSAKMFLLFHLDRPDVLPFEDLGVQLAVAQAYDVPREEAAAKVREFGPAWSPYASLAALTLWESRRKPVA